MRNLAVGRRIEVYGNDEMVENDRSELFYRSLTALLRTWTKTRVVGSRWRENGFKLQLHKAYWRLNWSLSAKARFLGSVYLDAFRSFPH